MLRPQEVEKLDESNTTAMLLMTQGLAGGVGATNFSVNLAIELASFGKDTAPKVCLIDADMQNGAIATYLGLTDIESIFDATYQGEDVDSNRVEKYLYSAAKSVSVICAPAELAPDHIIDWSSLMQIIDLIEDKYDHIIIDMPSRYPLWWESVAARCDQIFLIVQRDIRCSTNLKRLTGELKTTPNIEKKLKIILNRRSERWNFSERERENAMLKSTLLEKKLSLPKSEKEFAQANDLGVPVSYQFPTCRYRKELKALAQNLVSKKRNQT